MNNLYISSALSCACLSMAISVSALAGGVEKPAPSIQGFFLGAGGGFAAVDANHNDVSISQGDPDDNDNGFDYPNDFTETTTKLTPVVQGGYWGNSLMSSRFHWGAKVKYSYLNAHENYFIEAGHNTSETNFDTRVDHQLAFSLLLGTQINNFFPYIGGGAAWLPSVRVGYNFVGTSDGGANDHASDHQSHDLWGGIATIGGIYQLSPAWFLDAEYSYTVTPCKTYKLGFRQHNDQGDVVRTGSLKTKLNIHSQQFVISLNRRFAT